MSIDPQILRSFSQTTDADLQAFFLTGRGIAQGYRVDIDWKHTVFRADLSRDGKVLRRYEAQAGLDHSTPESPALCSAPLLLLGSLACARQEFRTFIGEDWVHA
jgi:hypothetical protein